VDAGGRLREGGASSGEGVGARAVIASPFRVYSLQQLKS
jgi:hypothetical protein